MMNESELINEVVALTLACQSGCATLEECARLERLLLDNPEAITWYLRVTDDTLTLSDAAAARHGQSTSAQASLALTLADSDPTRFDQGTVVSHTLGRRRSMWATVTDAGGRRRLLSKSRATLLAFNVCQAAFAFAIRILVAVFRYKSWRKASHDSSAKDAARRWVRPIFAAGAGMLLLAIFYEAWLRPHALKLVGRPEGTGAVIAMESGASNAIAQLTYTNGCSWGGGSPQFTALDSPVRPGDEIALYEGIAEFRLASGVSLSIEGPATLVLTSPTSLMLQHGRMTVFVPHDVTDFRLMAAGCRITGTGSEFGVQVAGGNIDIHAFSGEVKAAPAIADEQVAEPEGAYAIARADDLTPNASFSPVSIAAGKCLKLAINSDDTIESRWQDADETQFATKLSMAGKLPISKSYVSAVKKSQPLGYWRFEKAHDGSIDNEVSGLAELQVQGDVNFVGDRQNHALELGRPGSSGFLTCTNELSLPHGSDYSVEIWMKPSHNHNGGLVAMNVRRESETADPGAFCLLTWTGGRQFLRYLHRDPPGLDPKVGTDCRSDVPYRLRRWQHVVAVKRGPDMEIYLDGKLVGTKRDESSLAQHLCIIVGTSGIPRRGVLRPKQVQFIGQLDELAIYGRPLGNDEIKQHIDAVTWGAGRQREMQVNGI
jgi:hypothetical protein